MRLSNACQRFYRIKVCRTRGLRGTHTDVVKEARPLTVEKQLLSLGNVAQDLLARQGMSGVEMPQYRNCKLLCHNNIMSLILMVDIPLFTITK